MSPLVPLVAGVALLIAGVLFAVWVLWGRRGPRTEFHERFGQPLLVAAIIGLAFSMVQLATQLELRRSEDRQSARDREAQRRSSDEARDRAARDQLLLQITSRRNLRGIDLRGQDLRGVYLRGKNLREASLVNAKLAGATLDKAVLDGADLSGADLSGASLRSASVRSVLIDGTRFARADLTRARLSLRAELGVAADFSGALFIDSQLKGEFGFADFRGAQFVHTHMRRASFMGAKFNSALFIAILGGPQYFCTAELTGALFLGDFRRWDLKFADLRGVQLLRGTRFIESDLRGADVRGLRVVDKLSFTLAAATQEAQEAPDTYWQGGAASVQPDQNKRSVRFEMYPAENARPFPASAYDRGTQGGREILRWFGALEAEPPVNIGACTITGWEGWRPVSR